MQKQSTFRKYAALIALGFMGGTIFTTTYVRFTFYTQLLNALHMSNIQLGMATSITSALYIIIGIPGAYLSDKFEAKSVILFTSGGITLLALVFPLFVRGYTTYLLFQAANTLVMMAYWGCLMKYINNLGGEGEAGNSFGTYYLINGLSGAVGNAVPLWVSTRFGTGSINIIVFSMGIVSLIGTILVWLFLDNEKQLAARGIYLKGDEPIQLKHVAYVLKWPGTYMLAFAYCSTIILYENMTYMGPYLIDVFHMDESLSSTLAIVRQYGSLILAPFGGYMCDKVLKATYKWYIMSFVIIGLLYTGLVFLFGPGTSQIVVGAYTILPAAASMALYGVTFSILRELHIPAMISGTAVGLASLSGSVEAMILPPLFGYFLDNFGTNGYKYIFLMLVLDCVLGILNAMWVGSHNKKCLAGERKMDLSTLANAK